MSDSRRLGDLGTRAASAVVMIAGALASAWIGGLPFVIVWLAAAFAVQWEWQTLIGGGAVRTRVGVGLLTLLIVAVLVPVHLPSALLVLIVAAAVMAALAGGGCRLWAFAGFAYAGVLLSAPLVLRASPSDGLRAVLWLFATVWTTDTFAYFGGRLIGGPKLWPRVSPSKTWSGTITGLTGGTACGTLVALHGLTPPTSLLPVLIVTLLASILSQVGDALESAIKRYFGVKDSSRLIPGHGGVMDRVDGFVAAAAFAFCVGAVRDPHSVASSLFHWA